MPPLMGNGEGHTLLILTDAESRRFRLLLGESHSLTDEWDELWDMFNRGIARGTARLAEEFKAEQAARKAKKK